jgi:phage FluMu protein Com
MDVGGSEYSIMKCPRCGKEMDIGYIETESLFSGIKWRGDIHTIWTMVGVGGDLISGIYPLGLVRMRALRCKDCRLITFMY